MLAETVSVVRSGVFNLVYLNANGERLGSGSAFMSKGFLITNGHLLEHPSNTSDVWIRQDHEHRKESGVCLRLEDFLRRVSAASPANEYDYAVLDIPELTKGKTPYQFKVIAPDELKIGSTIAFLGYPFEHQSISCHTGIVSSLYKSGLVDAIQLDASVNPSNSGGPLFDPTTGWVFGIITRKKTGLTNLFREMKASIQAKGL